MTKPLRFKERGRPHLFGASHAPRLRWWCACGRANVTRLAVPIGGAVVTVCARCKRATKFDVAWGKKTVEEAGA